MSSFDPSASKADAKTIPTPFSPFRRIVTSHTESDTDGSDVLLHDDTYALKPVLGGRAHVGYIFSSLDLPSTSAHHLSADGVKEATDRCAGVVLRGGVNGQITDLPPHQGVGMHRTNSLDYNILLKGSVWLITPTKEASNSATKATTGGRSGSSGSSDGKQIPDEAKDGEEWTLVKAGDVTVQRGTMHAWKATEEGARWVTVVVDALPVKVDATGEELKERDFD